MTTTPDMSRVKATGPGAILALVPTLLGFEPSPGDVVAIALAGTRVGFTMRFDSRCDLSGIADVATRNGCDAAVLAGYAGMDEPDERIEAHEQLLREAIARFEMGGIEVRDILLVQGGRYRSALCTNYDCCPPEGTPIDTADPVVAEMVVAGVPLARGTRADVAASVAPLNEPTIAPYTSHLILSEVLDDIEALAEGRTFDASRVLTALTVREWVALRDMIIPERDYAFWLDLARRAHPSLRNAPYTIAAIRAHMDGSGMQASECLNHVPDPDYTMARLAGRALRDGMAPSEVERVVLEAVIASAPKFLALLATIEDEEDAA